MTKRLLGIALIVFAFGGAALRTSAQDSVFQNIQVLNQMSDREIQQTMQDWTRQFGVTCFECHVQGDFASDEMERKRIARQMAEMVLALNETGFFQESGWRADCFMCHKGSFDAAMVPSE